MELPNLRLDYSLGGLNESEADPDPFQQFALWFGQALAANLKEPNAMALATAAADGRPSVRMVLLKGFDPRGFVFFTNYESAKARELAENPQAALCFFWAELERQIRITGTVSKVSREDSETYFRLRPLGSRLGAWASKQSSVVPDRGYLEDELQRRATEFAGTEVPTPPFWGGYRVAPSAIEFWQGRQDRLHDRLLYTRVNDSWRIERLSP